MTLRSTLFSHEEERPIAFFAMNRRTHKPSLEQANLLKDPSEILFVRDHTEQAFLVDLNRSRGAAVGTSISAR